MANEKWVEAVGITDVPVDDVVRWDHEGLSYAIYRLGAGDFFATANVCTHEHAFLSEGFLEYGVIECPRHSGRFDVKTGDPLGAPVCDAIKTFPVKVENGSVFVQVEG